MLRTALSLSDLYIYHNPGCSEYKSINTERQEINSFTVHIKQGRYLLKRGSEIMGEYKKGGNIPCYPFWKFN
jgi:hypothetical protein